MALKQLIKTQIKWRKKTQKWVEIATATKITANVIGKKKTDKNCGFLLVVPQAYERESLLRNRNIGDPRFEDEND